MYYNELQLSTPNIHSHLTKYRPPLVPPVVSLGPFSRHRPQTTHVDCHRCWRPTSPTIMTSLTILKRLLFHVNIITMHLLRVVYLG